MRYTIMAILFLTFVSFYICSCGDASETIDLPRDYRAQWIGTYEGTKSNLSFADTLFTATINFDVEVDLDSDDGLVVKGINLPITEEGTFGPDNLDGGLINYELNIEGNELRLASFESLPNADGEPIGCFIIAYKN